jgi:hypothetical protein
MLIMDEKLILVLDLQRRLIKKLQGDQNTLKNNIKSLIKIMNNQSRQIESYLELVDQIEGAENKEFKTNSLASKTSKTAVLEGHPRSGTEEE